MLSHYLLSVKENTKEEESVSGTESIRNQYLCTIASFLLPTKTTHAKTASYGLDTSLSFFAVAFGSVFCSDQLNSEISAYPSLLLILLGIRQ